MVSVNVDEFMAIIKVIDLQQYLEWLFAQQPVSDEEKEGYVTMFTRNGIIDKEKAAKYVLEDTTYWKPPTTQEKENFPIWRQDEFERLKKFFTNSTQGSPFPLPILAKRGFVEAVDLMFENQFKSRVWVSIARRQCTDDYYTLGLVCGKIDYLKYLVLLIDNDKTLLKKRNCKDAPPETFTWKSTDKVLRALYDALVDKGWIDCNFEVWQGIFGKGELVEPVRWQGSNTLLTYLIDHLENLVKGVEYEKRYSLAVSLFEGKEGKLDNGKMARESQNYQNNKTGKPKNADIIDDAVKVK